MFDQSRRLSEPLSWGRREKTVVALVLSCVLLVAVGLGAFALTSGAPARAGCVKVTFPSTLGAAELHDCGAKARAVCASRESVETIGEGLRVACRKAGYPTPAGL